MREYEVKLFRGQTRVIEADTVEQDAGSLVFIKGTCEDAEIVSRISRGCWLSFHPKEDDAD